MNSLLKKTLGLLFILSFADVAYAQQLLPGQPSYPLSDVSAKPPYAFVDSTGKWSYAYPSSTATATPTIDKNAAMYLPALPWIGLNAMMMVNYADFFYNLEKHIIDGSTAPFNYLGTTTGNNILNQAQKVTRENANAATTKILQETVSFDPKNAANIAKLAQTPGTDTFVCTPIDELSGQCKRNEVPNNAQFNADTLLGSLGYSADKQPEIHDLIIFMANLTQPLPDPNLAPTKIARDAQLAKPAMQTYILAIRSLAALQSMALSNFNYLAQERLIIQGLGKQAKDPKDNFAKANLKDDVSQLQLDKFLIDRRLNNPEWYAQMNTAPSIAVQRETLFVLAELQRQMYEMRMINERMLATLSSMQTAMTQMGKAQLQVQANNLQKDNTQSGG